MAENGKTAQDTLSPAVALRRMRTSKGWTLKDLGKRTGLAISTLSKLENGHLSLTYDKLASLLSGLDLDVAQLLRPGLQPLAGPGVGQRRSVSRSGDGVLMQSKTHDHLFLAADLLHKQFTPILGEVRARSLEEVELLSHPGEEFTYVLEGAIELHTDVYAPLRLEIGQSVYFDSSMRHSYLAAAPGLCRILSVCSGAGGAHLT